MLLSTRGRQTSLDESSIQATCKELKSDSQLTFRIGRYHASEYGQRIPLSFSLFSYIFG
jgi:hypothetical protein